MFDFRPSVDFVPGLLASLEVRPTLLGWIGEAQRDDPQLVELVEKLKRGESSSHLRRYTLDDKGWLRRDGRLCVPKDDDLRKTILDEAHRSKMTIHPGGDKMYKDMKRVYFWAGMKKDVAEYVARCLGAPTSKSGAKETRWVASPIGGSTMEVGKCLDGFCGWVTVIKEG